MRSSASLNRERWRQRCGALGTVLDAFVPLTLASVAVAFALAATVATASATAFSGGVADLPLGSTAAATMKYGSWRQWAVLAPPPTSGPAAPTAAPAQRCVALAPADTVPTRAGVPLRPLRLLPVHVAYSANIAPFAANLLESMLASFHDDREGTRSTAEDRMGGAELPPEAATRERCGRERRNSTTVAFDGICVSLRALADAPSQRMSDRDSGDVTRPVETAPLRSAAYYHFLRLKLDYFSAAVATSASSSSTAAAAGTSSKEELAATWETLPWVLLIDADVQVFRGWDALLSTKIRCPDVAYNSGNGFVTDPVEGDRDKPTPRSAGVAPQPPQPKNAIFFQREGRKLVNTGVILAATGEANGGPAVRCLFREAQRIFVPRRGGDQTSIQRVLNRGRGWCRPRAGSGSGDGLAAAAPSAHELHHSVFRRDLVNAGVIRAQQEFVLFHHAHMSGGYKRENLRAVQQLRHRMDPERVHSGCFLASSPPHECVTPVVRLILQLLSTVDGNSAASAVGGQQRALQSGGEVSDSPSVASPAHLVNSASDDAAAAAGQIRAPAQNLPTIDSVAALWQLLIVFAAIGSASAIVRRRALLSPPPR